MSIFEYQPQVTVAGETEQMPSIRELVLTSFKASYGPDLGAVIYKAYMEAIQQRVLMLEVTKGRSITHRD